MSDTPSKRDSAKRKKVVQGEKLRGLDKVARIPVKVIPTLSLIHISEPTRPY